MDFLVTKRRGTHLFHLNPSREGSHKEKAHSKGQVRRDHSREDPRNRLRALLDREQNQGKDPLVRDPGKVRDHQAKDQKQAKVLLAKHHQVNRPPDQVKDHQVKANQGHRHPDQVRDPQVKDPSRVALPSKKAVHHHNNKDLGNLDPDSKCHKALGHILRSQQRVLGLLVSRELESLQVDSVHCVKPPS